MLRFSWEAINPGGFRKAQRETTQFWGLANIADSDTAIKCIEWTYRNRWE